MCRVIFMDDIFLVLADTLRQELKSYGFQGYTVATCNDRVVATYQKATRDEQGHRTATIAYGHEFDKRWSLHVAPPYGQNNVVCFDLNNVDIDELIYTMIRHLAGDLDNSSKGLILVPIIKLCPKKLSPGQCKGGCCTR